VKTVGRKPNRSTQFRDEKRTSYMTDKNTTSTKAQMLIDFGPLLIFFGTYKYYDLEIAIAVFMVAITGAMVWAKIKLGHVSGMQKLTFLIVIVSGSLTLYFDNKTFFYMKPTLVYALFATILGVGMLRGKLFLKDMLGKTIEADVPTAVWHRITKQAIGFFILMMAANEAIWRTQSEEAWVTIKSFGFTGAMFVFTLMVIVQLMKFMPTEDNGNAD
jgi:intracellular septation protein